MKTPNILKVRISVCFAIALVWLLAGEPALGYVETFVFRPASMTNDPGSPFSQSSTDIDTLLQYVNYATAAADADSGWVGLFSGAFEGWSKAQARQWIAFETKVPSAVEVTADIRYISCAFSLDGLLAKSETDWFWQGDQTIDDSGFHREAIDSVFDPENIISDIFGLLGMATPLAEGFTVLSKIGNLLDLIGLAYDGYQLGSALNDLSDIKSQTVTFTFTTGQGYHRLGIGLQGEAATISLPCAPVGVAFGPNYSLALIIGQIEQITVKATADPAYLPDLVIGDIIITNRNNINANDPIDITLIRRNIGSLPTDNDNYLLQVSRDDGNTWSYVAGRCLNNELFKEHTTKIEHETYTFPEKGEYRLRATADDAHFVTEANETNNIKEIKVWLKGWRPDPPAAPWAVTQGETYAPILHRNRQYRFLSVGRDHENDTLRFLFQTAGVDGLYWRPLRGWRPDPEIYVVPVLDDPELMPAPDPSIDPITYWTNTIDRLRLRISSADEDGLSDPSSSVTVKLALNDLPATPTITGETIGSTSAASRSPPPPPTTMGTALRSGSIGARTPTRWLGRIGCGVQPARRISPFRTFTRMPVTTGFMSKRRTFTPSRTQTL